MSGKVIVYLPLLFLAFGNVYHWDGGEFWWSVWTEPQWENFQKQPKPTWEVGGGFMLRVEW